MTTQTTAINFAVVLVSVLALWGGIGLAIASRRSDSGAFDEFRSTLLGYVVVTYSLSTVFAWGYVERPKIGEAAPVRTMTPHLIVLWDFAAWIPTELTAVLLVEGVLLAILVRARWGVIRNRF